MHPTATYLLERYSVDADELRELAKGDGNAPRRKLLEVGFTLLELHCCGRENGQAAAVARSLRQLAPLWRSEDA